MAREQKNFAQEKAGHNDPASSHAQSSIRPPLAEGVSQPHPKDGFHILLKALARDMARVDHAREH